MLILLQVRQISVFRCSVGGGDFIFICFVGHSAPFLYSDCLNTPARWLAGGGWGEFDSYLNYFSMHKFNDFF